MVSAEDYESGFEEFFTEARRSEKEGKFRVAVSNYYKALTEMCGYLILAKQNKIPKNHNEIFLFLKVSFPEIYLIADKMFKIYQETYISNKTKDECGLIKDGIRKIASLERFSPKIVALAKEEPEN